jgi:Na+-driven multidrug efflux pump
MFRAILKYGAPAAIQMSLVSLAMLTVTRLINGFGATAAAGVTAANRIEQFAMMPIMTMSMALSTFVAQNMGAGKEARAISGMRSSALFMVGLSVVLSTVILTFGPQIMSLFLDADDALSPGILGIGVEYLNIISMFYFLFAFLFAFNSFFRGAGDAIIAMVFPVVSLTLRTVSAYMMVGFLDMGPEALAWSIPIGWGITSLASFVYYKRRLWVGKVVAKVEKVAPK